MSSFSVAGLLLPVPRDYPGYPLNGFVIMAPTGPHWYLNTGSSDDVVEFRRSTDRGNFHTVVARAESSDWPYPEDGVNDILRQLEARLGRRDKTSSGRELDVRVEVLPSPATDLPCVETRSSWYDRGVPWALGKLFKFEGWALYCVHPNASRPMVVALHFSQRYLAEAGGLSLDSEVASFREGVKAVPDQAQ